MEIENLENLDPDGSQMGQEYQILPRGRNIGSEWNE